MKKWMTLIQILFLCIFLGCGIYIAKFIHDKNVTEEEFEEIQSLVQDFGGTPFGDAAEGAGAEEAPASTPAPERYEENGMLSRYYKLYQENPDTVGWIKIADTSIDYPVMYNKDSNAYYLHRNFRKQESSAGIPYMDYQCTLDGSCDNYILYGHNMRNGTMFHDLLDYEDRSFWENHRYIGFDTLYHRCRYEVFAVFHTRVGAKNEFKYYNFVKAETREEFDSYVQQCIELSEFKTGIVPQFGEKLLTLSTCSYNFSNERFVVAARLIEMK